ncbi:MAG TPA: hypothetical protein ENJ30_06100 [Desulfobulbaceae bacterium]|nr:hypothetical protein [Desulfobulbaceae bacterium]
MQAARTAYEAYCEATGGKSLVTGNKLPDFEVLSYQVRLAWKAAAKAVEQRTFDINFPVTELSTINDDELHKELVAIRKLLDARLPLALNT